MQSFIPHSMQTNLINTKFSSITQYLTILASNLHIFTNCTTFLEPICWIPTHQEIIPIPSSQAKKSHQCQQEIYAIELIQIITGIIHQIILPL